MSGFEAMSAVNSDLISTKQNSADKRCSGKIWENLFQFIPLLEKWMQYKKDMWTSLFFCFCSSLFSLITLQMNPLTYGQRTKQLIQRSLRTRLMSFWDKSSTLVSDTDATPVDRACTTREAQVNLAVSEQITGGFSDHCQVSAGLSHQTWCAVRREGSWGGKITVMQHDVCLRVMKCGTLWGYRT